MSWRVGNVKNRPLPALARRIGVGGRPRRDAARTVAQKSAPDSQAIGLASALVLVCEICGHRYHVSGRTTACPFDGGRLIALQDPLIGRLIGGRYVVQQKIGQGGFAVVYRAQHDSLGQEVALKFLLPELALDPSNRERFLREARAANRIDHEHIIDITDFGQTDDGLVFLVMELLDGVSLADEVEKGPLSAARAIEITLQCASALSRAHELGVVHRDIKPENIHLVTAGPTRDFVKLLDFGLAHMKGELRLTATGAVFGTPEYMSPEQGRGAALGPPSDLYSLGCVLYEMLVGAPPFRGTTPDLILQHMREPAPRVSKRSPGVPEALDLLVAKLLEKDPSRRHRDAFHLIEELRSVQDSLPRVRMSVAPDDLVKTRERRRSHLDAPRTAIHVPSAWERRVGLLRELSEEVHGSALPEWLERAHGALYDQIVRLLDVERELARVAEAASLRETEIRNVRLRLGRAVDELGRDESRATGALEALGPERALVESNGADHGTRAAFALSRIRETEGPMGDAIAALLRDAGEDAAAWLAAKQRLAEIDADLRTIEQERDDLRFQVAQLKGRLAAVTAEQDLDLAALRDTSLALDRERAQLLDVAARQAALITQHLATFPGVRERLGAETPLAIARG